MSLRRRRRRLFEARRKLDLIGSHTFNPSPSVTAPRTHTRTVRALQLVHPSIDLWSLPLPQSPNLLSFLTPKVQRKHRASNPPPSTHRNPSPIHLVNLPLLPPSRSPKNPKNPAPRSGSPRYLLPISLFMTHMSLIPSALTHLHTPRLVNHRHMSRARER